VDPLLLEALRFGLAILAGGFVAVIAQRLAFRDARRVERERTEEAAAARRHELLAPLRAEITQNMEALDRHRTHKELAELERSAWILARGLSFRTETAAALRVAYREAEKYMRLVQGQSKFSTTSLSSAADLMKQTATAVDPVAALMAFDNAQRELADEERVVRVQV
jgi:hypothetical protein